MKKKQVALLLAALMCITPMAESAAVMGAEFSSGEETVEMQGTEEEAEAEDTAEIWTSGEEVSDFDTDEAPEVDGFTSEESEASTDAAGAKQVKGSFEVAYITEEQYNNALQNEERPEVDMKTVEDTTFSNALNSIEGENTGYCFVSVQDLEDAADFVAPEGMTVLVENARVRSITPNGNIAFWGMVDPPDGDYKSGDYDQVMTTIDEFNQITQSMYDKGYVMVSIYDMATADENGNMNAGEILLPPGKVPFVLSQDDVCYYHYMDGDGFATKLIVDEEGKIRNEYVEDDGSISVGDYDMVPLIDRFVEEHPDFSYRGAKGIVALTGYNGILGYRTDSSYETRPDDLDADKVKWLDEHPDFNLNTERENAARVAQAMKDEGWLFASHTWGHQNVSQISLERLQADTQKFKENVDPLIGGTDIIIFAFGADLTSVEDYSGEKFEYLKSQGYNYYCNVDSSQYFVQIRSNYFRQGRRNLDGYRMYYNPELLSDLFDAQSVFDSSRPVPVPTMG